MSRMEPPGGPVGEPRPLVLHCRPLPRCLWLVGAVYFLFSGTAFVSRGLDSTDDSSLMLWRGAIGLLLGACTSYYAARYCLARLILDDHGFRLRGPLGERSVGWSEVVAWRRRPPTGGLAPNILILHGPDHRRLFVPLIYEDSHALEVGLSQGRFPSY